MFADDAIALGAKARLLSVNLCSGNVEADRGMPTDGDILPWANVYVVSDDAEPEGNAPRTGIRRFEHSTTLVVEVIQGGDTAREVKAWLSQVGEGVMQALMRDLDWAVWTDDKPFLEGCAGVRRIYDSPPKGEEIVIRLQLQFRLLARSSWAPDDVDLDDLSQIQFGVSLNGDEPVIGATVPVPQEP